MIAQKQPRPCRRGSGPVVALAVILLATGHGAVAQVESDEEEELPASPQEQLPPRQTNLGASQPSTMIGREASRDLFETGRYRVGPGDGFMVMLGTDAPKFFKVMVEGGLLIPGLGHVQVGGKSLKVAREAITTTFHRRYKEGDVHVELSELRQFPVNVVGAVQRPGRFVTSGVVRVSELIRQAGISGASRRNIRLVKTDSLDEVARDAVNRFVSGGSMAGVEAVSARVDLDLFQATGDSRYNPYVVDGDQILVPREGGRITVHGAVQRPGDYEFVPGDRISDLLTLGLGMTPDHDADHVYLYRYVDDMVVMKSREVDIRDALEGGNANLHLQTGDMLVIRALENYLEPSTINIRGEVPYPGYYVIHRGVTRLREVLEAAGGFTDEASLEASRLYRRPSDEEQRDPEFERIRSIPVGDRHDDDDQYFTMKSREIRGRMVVDFVGLFIDNDESQNIELMPGDLIVVPERLKTVKVSGQAAFPGSVVHHEIYRLEDYIAQAGGFAWRASDDVRVIKARTGETKPATEVKVLQPGDRIWIKEKSRHDYWAIFTQVMTVVGNAAALVIVVIAL